MRYFLILLFFLILCLFNSNSQVIGNYIGDESILYAQTKQVGQFFRRFNAEEDQYGERFSINDSLFRNPDFRKKFLNMLFDKKSIIIKKEFKKEFIDEVVNKKIPSFLNFHGGNWFAEVKTKFIYYDKEKTLTLFLQLEEEKIGSKWVITNVYFQPFHQLFLNHDTIAQSDKKFLHPLSHELDFMNLIKIFNKNEIIEQYAAKEYYPDYLTLFIYEFKKSNLKFETVINVKFHFFQINGWYFELSDFNRRSYNSGWLISNLLKISEDEKNILMRYIYHE